MAPGGKLQLGVSHENNFGYLPQGDFIIRWRTRAR
jgi:hypothetical protein